MVHAARRVMQIDPLNRGAVRQLATAFELAGQADSARHYQALADSGLVLSGVNQEADLVEIVEIQDHPWFLGCQFHPEFKSRPLNPHPLFRAFIAAALENRPA